MTAPRWVAALGVFAVVAALAIALLQRGERLSGTNLAPDEAFVVNVKAGQEACQGEELLPADTAAVRVAIETFGHPGPPLGVLVRSAGGRVLTSGSLPAGWREGAVRVPVDRVRVPAANATVCLRDREAASGHREIALGGTGFAEGFSVQLAGRSILSARLRYEYLRPGRESWYELLPAIVHRFSLAKAQFLRHWEWVAALLLVLATIAVALWVAIGVIATGADEGGAPDEGGA